MNGEIDLELYTISIIRLNNALENLENTPITDETKEMFKTSCNDLNELYTDIVNDLNNEEIQFSEYYLFFENGKQMFPHYIKTLESIENTEIKDEINSLINIFNNLSKIAEAFPSQQDLIK
ncbi:hypothetical protein [uncultured Methanobrevibacter sp.]|uniref:hypothetical protein n=1 Tax=uncultured Methanobrevibacter sp. TaxID=253161 RepID=UPI0025FDD240|nr:hypothetical protein [uncultured Methanobrevibacter sp.]